MSGQTPAEAACIFIRLPSQTRFLALERALVRETSRLAGFDDEQSDRIVLAVDEACANIIRHGYGGPCDRPIEISVAPPDGAPEGIRMTIRDYGRQVDPDVLIPRDVTEVRPGGLGVHIIFQVMDDVRYSLADGGGMQLVLTKRLSGPAGEPRTT
jgi:anti-sigma regulatory factor (Ser/Thr protein kinase)